MNHIVSICSSVDDCYCLVAKLCLALCDPMDCSTPGSSVHGISQAKILEWVTISVSRGSSQPRDQICLSYSGRLFFFFFFFLTTEPPGSLKMYHIFLSIHQLMMGIWIISTFWLLEIMLLRIFTASFVWLFVFISFT